jgi:SAM-dependent methyltransferase
MPTMKDNVRTVFSSRAAEWAGWYSNVNVPTLETNNLLSRQRLAFEMVAGAVQSPATVLDVGCGTGEMAGRLLGRGYDVSGVDIAEPMVQRARERWGIERFEVADSEHLPFEADRFDAAVCLGVIEYQDADARTLREIHRVLKPVGCAVLSTPNAVSPLYFADQAILAVEEAVKPLYYLAKYRLRRRSVPAEPTSTAVAIRRYRRSSWLRLLRSVGLEPEDWVCRGWGWHKSRFGQAISFLAKGAANVRHAAAPIVGERVLSRASNALIRNRAVNWIGAEQLVRVRAIK